MNSSYSHDRPGFDTQGGALPPLYGAQQENSGQYSQQGWYGQHGTVPSGVPGYPTVPPGYHPQSRVAAACLAFFLGGFGAHNFYIGLRGRAIVQLCVTLGSVAIIFLGAVVMLIGLGDPNVSYDDDEVMTGLGALLFIGGCLLVLAVTIWAFVELFMILASNGRYGQDRYGVLMR